MLDFEKLSIILLRKTKTGKFNVIRQNYLHIIFNKKLFNMKKSLLFVVLMVFTIVQELKARCENIPDSVPKIQVPIELSCFNSFKNKGVTLHGYNLDLGVNIFKRVAVIGSAEFNTFHLGETNNYCNTFQLGGGVLYQPIKDKYKVLSVKGKVGRTTSDSEMKNTSYDVSVGYARIFGDCGVLGAVGFRVCDYKNSFISDNHYIYISVGLGF